MTKFLFALMLSFMLNAIQAQQFNWGSSIGGGSTDLAQRIAIDSSGNVFCAGLYTAPCGVLPAYGFQDIHLSKYTSDGFLLWQIGIGGANNDQVNAIATDTAGDVWVVGRFQGNIDLNPGDSVQNVTSNPAGALEGFIARYDGQTGMLIEYRDITSGGTIDIRTLKIDQYNDIFIAGQYTQTVNFDFNGGSFSKTSNIFSGDCFVGRYYGNLQLVWMNVIGSQTPAIDFISDICLGGDGYVYCTGLLGGTADINPAVASTNLVAAVDAFLIRYSQNDGSLSWGFLLGGSSLDLGNSVMMTEDGNVVIAGSTNSSTMDVDPGIAINLLTKTGVNAAPFLGRYSSTGTLVSAILMEGDGAQTATINRIFAGPDNTIMLTGNYKGNLDLELGDSSFIVQSGDSTNAFVARYMTDWSLMQYFELGGNGDQIGNDIVLDGSKVYVCGQMSNTIFPQFPDLELQVPRISSGNDGFLIQYNLEPDALSTVDDALHVPHVYPNPTNGLVYSRIADSKSTRIYDASGRQVEVSINTGSIDFTPLPAGIYLVVFTNNQHVGHARVIKY